MSLVEGKTAVFERGQYVYLVSPIAPFEPAEADIDEFSFASQIRGTAPNPHLLWMQGTYVEAGRPIDHGDHSLEWSADDLSIKSLTPVLMPVTVMHDPRTAVGMIANTKLVPGDINSPTRIDNTIAVWKHRFPEIAEEVSSNHARGTMMQSQECRPTFWECAPCGQRFLDKGAIVEHQSLEHSALNGGRNRKLGDVTFTGTGLIFGTRGVKGALQSAHLHLLEEEVSEFHERSRTDKPYRPNRRTSKVDIEQREYEALVTKASKVDDLTVRIEALETSAAKVPGLEHQIEVLEVEKKTAVDEASAEKTKREQLEEQSRAVTLASERTGKLGAGFQAKLPDSIKAKLTEQAKTLSDEAWSERLEELSELTGVKSDDAGSGDEDKPNAGASSEFSREETSRTTAGAGGGNGGSGGDASRAATSQVVGSLLRTLSPQPTRPESKGSS